MYSITDRQIDFILNDLDQHGIRIESLKYNLLDHICIIIEQNLEAEGDFEAFYAATLKAFYKEELREIEEAAIFLLAAKNRLGLSRNQFFLLLFILLIGPFIGYDLVWWTTSGQAAGWSLPQEIWASTLAFSLFPLLTFLVLFLTPERLEPLIPRKSTILIGINPIIKVIPHSTSQLA